MTKVIRNFIKENRREFTLLVIVLLIGAFLRLFRISEYMTFLGDEGRDVIVVRRLLVNFDPILVGPGTSIGNMYLGPIYYYLMAPALLIANFSPAGPAIMIALIGVATIYLVWYIAREWFGKYAAFIASFLYAISPTIIIYSRSSWNPNIMPFFALLTIYSIWRVWQNSEWRWLIVIGISFAFVLQSHYLGLLLLPTLGVIWLLTAFVLKKEKKKKEIKTFLKNSGVGLIIFLILMSPLVIFDARHGWRNFSAMQEFFAKRQTTVSARPWSALPKIWPIFEKLTTRLIGGRDVQFGKWAALGILGGVALIVRKTKRKLWLKDTQFKAFFLIFLWLSVALIGLGVYKQEIYDHYYGFFFAAPFLLFGGLSQYLIAKAKKKGLQIVFVLTLLLTLVSLKENPLKYPPNRQLQRTETVAAKIQEESNNEKFNIAVIAERNYEGAYWYFLEMWNTPIVGIDPQREDETVANQLFVVCELEREKCQPTSNPKAEIANFGWSKIETEWNVAGVTLFKLAHTK